MLSICFPHIIFPIASLNEIHLKKRFFDDYEGDRPEVGNEVGLDKGYNKAVFVI